jgi:ABC-2 type transport system permease protein
MSLNRIMAIVLRQFYLMSGSPARIPPLFIWVGIDIVLWGFISKYLNTVTSPGFSFTLSLLGAVLLWDFFVRVMHGVTMAFFEDVWSRNFLNFFASPLRISEYLSGLVLTSIGTSLLGLIVMLLVAIGAFGLPFFSYGLALIPFLLVLFLFGIALGIIGSGVVLRLGPAAEWFIWPIPAIISPFAGVFYPISVLPHWMQWIAALLPPSYVFEGLRAIVQGESIRYAALVWGIILALGYILLAYWFFTRVYRHAVRSGLIARYSAESLS